MTYVIRKSTWETNSSSVHAIVIKKNSPSLCYPEEIVFKCDDFGWEFDTFCDPNSKASYLYTMLHCLSDVNIQDDVDFIKDTLEEVGIKASFVEEGSDCCYIDHPEDLQSLYESIFTKRNKDLLLSYLLCYSSVIKTGNDNDDKYDYYKNGDEIDDDFNESDYELFTKGN